MRQISDRFMDDLTAGPLSPLRELAQSDQDIALEIRENYINLYFKGYSVAKLSEHNPLRVVPDEPHRAAGGSSAHLHPATYRMEIHERLRPAMASAQWTMQSDEDLQDFMAALPEIKRNVCNLEKNNLEIEFEQLVIRANNRESRLLTDYLIIDRQLVIPNSSCRFDLTAIHLTRGEWHRSHQVPLALFELKFGLNTDIGDIHNQLRDYYETICTHIRDIARETESILKQKLELELISHPKRLEAFRKLTVIPDIDTVRFGIVLIDYAPESKLLNVAELSKLKFATQIDVFNIGLGLWRQNARPLAQAGLCV